MDKEEFKLDQILLEDRKVFRDAVHNYIPVDHTVILDLINSSEMQRLRRIKQLGGTFQVYQTAEHSRFVHSLGVYAIVIRMINESIIGERIDDYDKLVVMCAGLLHDIGHGPFSHSFESITGLSHEEYTIKIILDDTNITTILNNCIDGLASDVAKVINKTYENKIVVQMISSQLDADRMDYLLRDSYFTGTTYGQFDLARILRITQVCNGKIVYKESGVQAIEDYILARYHMYWQVYYHPTTRSYERILISIFKRIKDLYNEGFDLGDIRYLEPILKGSVSAKEYLQLDEGIINYYFRCFLDCKDEILNDLTNRFLNRKLFIYDNYQGDKHQERIEQHVRSLGYNPRYYVLHDDISQMPYLHYGDDDAIGEIQILKQDKLVSLPEASEIVGALTSAKSNKDDHKIFYPEI